MQTMAIALPPGAEHVVFGPGMGEAGATVIDGHVVRGKTMLPGPRQHVWGYEIPVKDGKATLTFTAPAPTTLFALYVEGNVTVDSKEGLDVGTVGGQRAEENRTLLKAKGMKAGQVASVSLSGIKPPPPPATKPAEVIDQTTDLNLPVPKKESK
jgi:hypothetical protein